MKLRHIFAFMAFVLLFAMLVNAAAHVARLERRIEALEQAEYSFWIPRQTIKQDDDYLIIKGARRYKNND